MPGARASPPPLGRGQEATTAARVLTRNGRRPLAERDLRLPRLAAAQELHGDLVARLVVVDRGGHVVGRVHLAPVDLDDQVATSRELALERRPAAADAGLVGRATGDD